MYPRVAGGAVGSKVSMRLRMQVWFITGVFVVLALSGAIVPGCVANSATAGPASDVASGPPPQALVSDVLARPPVYREDEVDYRAAPLEPIEPTYPRRARLYGIEGEVECQVTVWPDGRARSLEILSSSDEAFENATRNAIREARFRPAMLKGRPVASNIVLRVRFRLR